MGAFATGKGKGIQGLLGYGNIGTGKFIIPGSTTIASYCIYIGILVSVICGKIGVDRVVGYGSD